jgi:uncharacterized membrane protein
MNMKKIWSINVIIALIPLLVGLWFWNDLPEKVAIHWSLDGTPDNYVSKRIWVFMIPVISILLMGIFWSVPKIDPLRNYVMFEKTYYKYLVILQLLLLTIFLFMLLNALGRFDIYTGVIYASVVFLLLMGNYLGKLRPSFFVGIRTPWTLKDDTVWVKTHRFAGYLWVYLSLLTIITFIFLGNRTVLSMAFIMYLFIVIVVPVVYSLLLFMRLKRKAQ